MKLLLDLGATSIKCALIDNNQLVVTRSIPSPSRKNYSTTPDQYTIPASVFKFRIETLLDSMTDEPIDAHENLLIFLIDFISPVSYCFKTPFLLLFFPDCSSLGIS